MLANDIVIPCDRGKYQTYTFELFDLVSNTPVNLTGYDLYASFRERYDTPLLLTIGGDKVAAVDRPNGKVQLTINESDSLRIPSRDATFLNCCDTQYTCWCQIDGIYDGRRYQLVNIAIDNISSTYVGG
jgi:hypothetical protein